MNNWVLLRTAISAPVVASHARIPLQGSRTIRAVPEIFEDPTVL